MTAPKRTGYHHGNLEQALVAAVRSLVERDGAAGFSMAEACKMAGVSTAAPYRHFRDKKEILARVAEAGFRDLTADLTAARDALSHEAAAERIAGLGKAYVAFALANPNTFGLMFGSAPQVKDDSRVWEAGHGCFSVLIHEVARFLGEDPAQTEPRELSVMLWTFVHGVAALAHHGDYEVAEVPIETDRLVERATGAVLAAAPRGDRGAGG